MPNQPSNVSCSLNRVIEDGRPASRCCDSETAPHVGYFPCAQTNTSDALARIDFADTIALLGPLPTVLKEFDARALHRTSYLGPHVSKPVHGKRLYYIPCERARRLEAETSRARWPEAMDGHSELFSGHLPQMEALQFLG